MPEFDPTIAEEFGYGIAETQTFLGVPIFEADSIYNLLIRFGFNLLAGWILIHFAYFRRAHRRDYYLTFLLFSTTMFLMIFLMENVKLQIGFTLGLFAIFGMIRYRTETVPVREMTYLFVIIGLSVINGLAMTVSYAEIFLTNALLIGLCFLLEWLIGRKQLSEKLILYEKIDLIVPEKRQEMIADLEQRTGIHPIVKVEIGHIDLLRDATFVKIFYKPAKDEIDTIGTNPKPFKL
ncbi:MAG: DUF4956 domain-containing protein [Paludibacteraceae bacterium]|nr:DUF4956 domain-containing protein [Paludibacteraceae bacterium]